MDQLVSNLRWLWLILAAVFVIVYIFFSDVADPSYSPLIVVVVGFILNGIYAGLLAAGRFSRLLAGTASVLDIVLAIALLILMGEQSQRLLPIMLFPVLLSGVRWGMEAGLLMAVPLALVYAGPVITILLGEGERTELTEALLNFGISAVALFIVGGLPASFIKQRVEMIEQQKIDEYERLRIENERGNLIAEMAVKLSSTLNYRKVLKEMLDLAFAAMTKDAGDAKRTVALAMLFEGEGNSLSITEGRNLAARDQGRRFKSDLGIVGQTIQSAEAQISNTVQKDKALPSFPSFAKSQSAICVPLRAGFDTYGVVLFCSAERNRYNENHKKLLTAFSSQAIIPLQNAQLFDDLRREQQRILELEAEARRKLARDLHDGPTQSVAAIAMRLNFLKLILQNNEIEKAREEVANVEQIAQRTTQEIRTMLFAMRPVILETQGLVPALQGYAERLNANESFRVRIMDRGYTGQLDKEAEGVVFAIVEEAVGNAKKHAQATEIRISLVVRNETLFVEIRDNGVGFDVEKIQATYDQRSSLGLINMDERAQAVGGHCDIESARGKGTAVYLEIPLNAESVE